MKIVAAIDSFKGSMTSMEAGNAFARGARQADPNIEVTVRPVADGGEGTVQALVEGLGGRLQCVTVTGPLGEPTDCVYGIIEKSRLKNGNKEDRENSDIDNYKSDGIISVHHTDAGGRKGDEHGSGGTAAPGDLAVLRADGAAGPGDLAVLGADGATGSIDVAVLEADSAAGLGNLAVIEMSGAAGLTLVPENQRNPLNTTTYGVGEVIRDAIRRGCRRFIIGIGGSATNDGGAGMLQALGFGLLDKGGNQIVPGARGLKDLFAITDDSADPVLPECTFLIACDVNNPLCGKNGASAVFGPQKGADESMIRQMDQYLAGYARLAAEKYPDRADAEAPGTGAAGGLGFAFQTFLGGQLRPGIEIVLEETGLEDYIKEADLVITGEGRLDRQSVMGKAPVGVARLAKKYNKPVIAMAGSVTKDANVCNQKGIDAFFPIVRGVCSLEQAMNPENARENMSQAAAQVCRLLKLCRN